MTPNPIIGVLLYVLGGLAGASFYMPLKRVRKWAWESFWLMYAFFALLILPLLLALFLSPNVFKVISATPSRTLLTCFAYGAMWGVGGLTWGLMIRYLGVGLGLAIGCGVCAGFGTLIPPIVEGKFGTLFHMPSGQATLAGVAIALIGIVVTGMAGMSKERELSDEQKKAGVAEFNFKRGIIVAIFSGIASAGLNFGISGEKTGDIIAALTQSTEPKTPDLWKGLPVLVVVLAGGFLINLVWCVWLNIKNRSASDYVKSSNPLFKNYLFAGAAGLIWYLQFVFFTMGATKIGDYKYSGWTLLMSSQILFSTIFGITLHEWKGCSSRTKQILTAGLIILVISLVVIGYGNYLDYLTKLVKHPGA